MIPTSNHNLVVRVLGSNELYIFWFLHQTTTVWLKLRSEVSCISFDSYIKPQPSLATSRYTLVVYLLIPTSNHNQTQKKTKRRFVVYLLIPTSNHNFEYIVHNNDKLYIFWFLHQTTTIISFILVLMCCISFDSYIKPQPITFKYQRTSIL